METTYDLAMLIDDHDISNFVAQNVLMESKLFRNTILQPSAFSALNYLKMHMKNAEEIPDLILLDIHMPSVDGFRFLREFENLSPQIRNKANIVVLSGNNHEVRLRPWLDKKMILTSIEKPFNRSKLELILGELA